MLHAKRKGKVKIIFGSILRGFLMPKTSFFGRLYQCEWENRFLRFIWRLFCCLPVGERHREKSLLLRGLSMFCLVSRGYRSHLEFRFQREDLLTASVCISIFSTGLSLERLVLVSRRPRHEHMMSLRKFFRLVRRKEWKIELCTWKTSRISRPARYGSRHLLINCVIMSRFVYGSGSVKLSSRLRGEVQLSGRRLNVLWTWQPRRAVGTAHDCHRAWLAFPFTFWCVIKHKTKMSWTCELREVWSGRDQWESFGLIAGYEVDFMELMEHSRLSRANSRLNSLFLAFWASRLELSWAR